MPTTRAELSKFIGCVNFCSPFIFGLSTYTSILTPLLSTTVKFEMAQIHIDAINDILEQLRQAPHLYLVDKDHDIYVAIDSSYTGSGSVFYQLIGERKHIIHFHSLTFTNMEKQGLGSLQKELLGIIRTLTLNKRIIHTHPNDVIKLNFTERQFSICLLYTSPSPRD